MSAPVPAARQRVGLVLAVSLPIFVLGSVGLLWSRAHLYPLRSGGRSKILYTISAVGLLLIVTIPLQEAVGPLPIVDIISRGMYVPCAVFPLAVAFRRYFHEWRIHSLLQQLVEQRLSPETTTSTDGGDASTQTETRNSVAGRERRSRTFVKSYEEEGAGGNFGPRVQAQVKHLRDLASLRTSLRHVACCVVPCFVVTLAFAVHYATLSGSDVGDAQHVWLEGQNVRSVGFWFRMFRYAVCIGALGWLVREVRLSSQQNIYDSFGVRREYYVACTGAGLYLVLATVLHLALPVPSAALASYAGVAASIHVVASMMLWPALRTFTFTSCAKPRVRGLSKGMEDQHLVASAALKSAASSSGRKRKKRMFLFGATAAGRGNKHAATEAAAGAALSAAMQWPGATIAAELPLSDILASDTGYSLFAEHLRDEFAVESLLFWRGCAEFRDAARAAERAAANADERDGPAKSNAGRGAGIGAAAARREARVALRHSARNKARELLNLYVAEDAPFEVNISWKQRLELMNKVSAPPREPGVASAAGQEPIGSAAGKRNGSSCRSLMASSANAIRSDVFDAACDEVFQLMERDSLPRFKASRRWLKFLAARARAASDLHSESEPMHTALNPLREDQQGVDENTTQLGAENPHASHGERATMSSSACAHDELHLEGVLQQQVTTAFGQRRAWRRGFFALEEGAILARYDNRNSVDAGATETFMLNARSHARIDHGNQFSLHVERPACEDVRLGHVQMLVLKAPGAHQASQWVHALTAAAEAVAAHKQMERTDSERNRENSVVISSAMGVLKSTRNNAMV